MPWTYVLSGRLAHDRELTAKRWCWLKESRSDAAVGSGYLGKFVSAALGAVAPAADGACYRWVMMR